MSGSKDNHAGLNGRPDDAASKDDLETADLTPDTDQDATAEVGGQDSTQTLQDRLARAEETITTLQDDVLRARAEVENTRRRAQDEVSKARKFGIESFAESLVPVKDSLEAALAQPDQDAQAWQQGVEATLRQLVNAFERNAMKDVAPEAGDRFDPHLHQAISTIPSGEPEGCVAQLLQKGYTIAGRVLRPALVMVSAGTGAQGAGQSDDGAQADTD